MVKRSFQLGGIDRSRALTTSGTALIAVTYGVLRYGFGLQLPRLGAEFGLSSATAGVVAAGSFSAYCVAALVARWVLGRRGARVVLGMAAALASVGAALVTVAWSGASLAVGVVLAGSAAGAASPALVDAVASSVPAPRRPRAQAVVNAGTGIGVALVGAAVLAAPDQWRPVWALAAVLALLAAAGVDRAAAWPVVASQPDPPQPHAPEPDDREPDDPEPEEDREPDRTLLRPVVAAVVAGLGSAAVWTFGRDLVTTAGGLSARTTAVLWILLGTAAVLGGLSGDAVRILGLRRAWVLMATLTAVGTALFALAPGSTPVVAAAGILFGGAYTTMSGVLVAWASALRPAAAGQGTAVLLVALTAGQAAGAAVTGLATDLVGGRVTFWLCALVLVAAAAIRPAQASPRRSRIQARVNARSFQAW